MNFLKFILLFIFIFIFASCSKSKKLHVFEFQFFKMDTDLSVKYVAQKRNFKMEKEIKEYINRFDRENSFYKKESFLSQINKLKNNESLEVPHYFCKMLEMSANYNKTTENRFNIAYKSPGEYRNFNNLQISCKNDVVKVNKKGTILDTGGIAKGYSIDETGNILKKYGYKNFIVNYGGDMLVCGKKNNHKSWVIGIKSPFDKYKILKKISKNIKNCYAVATSGDYKRYIVKEGKKYSHIIDPKTGLSVKGAHSVTVIADNATKADVLATAISVGNKDAGYIKRMKKKFKIEIYMLRGKNYKQYSLFVE